MQQFLTAVFICGLSRIWWTDVSAECQAPGRNANVFYTPDRSVYAIRSKVTYACSDGSRLHGSRVRNCLKSKRWSGKIPSCSGTNASTSEGYGTPPSKPSRRPGTSGPSRVICSRRSPPANGRYTQTQQSQPTWFAGEFAIFRCQINFELIGSQRSRCQNNGKWSAQVPTCRRLARRVSCRRLSPPRNGRFIPRQRSKTVWYPGEVSRIICAAGYRLTGDNPRCQSDGTWSSNSPVCEAFCPVPTLPSNGFLVQKSVKTVWNVGETVQYKCNSGYNLVGNNIATCQPNGTWSPSGPVCEEVRCPHRPPPVNGVYIQDIGKTVWRPGDIARYRCNPNYALRGHDYTDCRNDGTWRFKVPKCQLGCARPPNSKGGAYFSSPTDKTSFTAGDTIAFRCNIGYRLVGEARVHCQSDGWADLPSCRLQVTCPHRQAPENGIYIQDVGKTQWYVGDIARYRCNEGFIMIGHSYIDCLPNSRWRFHVPSCRRPYSRFVQSGGHHGQPRSTAPPSGNRSPSPRPPTGSGSCTRSRDPQNGKIVSTPQNKRTFAEGEHVIYVCNNQYFLVGKRRVVCRNGIWSHVPFCQKTGCVRPDDPKFGTIRPPKTRLFSDGEFVTYSCGSNYRLAGGARVYCRDNQWTHEPFCRRPCADRNPPGNSRYANFQRKWFAGDVAIIECSEGFRLVGESRSTCQIDGTWQNDLPTCRRAAKTPQGSCENLCGVIDVGGCTCDSRCFLYNDCCSDYNTRCQSANQSSSGCNRPRNPSNGIVLSWPSSKTRFTFGEIITFQCNSGYDLVGEVILRCRNSGWTSSPSCQKKVTCPHREAPQNGGYIEDDDKRQWFVGEIARYRCNQNYITIGSSHIDCLPNGTWRYPLPTCRLYFSIFSPPTDPNAELLNRRSSEQNSSSQSTANRGFGCVRPRTPRFGSIDPPAGDFFADGDIITYSCQKNYGLRGAVVHCGHFRWSHEPLCRRRCPARNPPGNGRFVNFQKEWLTGDIALVTCADGYDLIGHSRSSCQTDGTWQYRVPSCRERQ